MVVGQTILNRARITAASVPDPLPANGVDSALVVDGGYVVGVFTTTDALRVLSRT